MAREFLDFERPIAEMEARIHELRHTISDVNEHISIAEEIAHLEKKRDKLVASIFENLTPSQVVQVARHPERPYTTDYIARLVDDFDELHGDRHFSDDAAIVSGIGRFEGQPVAVIGQQKGREVSEKIKHNFGMPSPEGYRKAARIMRLAERFGLPVLTLIDTPGAYPGIGAEERNQSEAIAHNLYLMAQLKTPIVCCVIGEGGSGGALAIGVGDHVAMLENSIYSVISPEGCASILWKSATKASEAAEAMGVTAQQQLKHGLVDAVIPEPTGGAHRDYDAMAQALRSHLKEALSSLQALDMDALLERRYERLMRHG